LRMADKDSGEQSGQQDYFFHCFAINVYLI